MSYQDEWKKAAELASLAASALDRARYAAEPLTPMDDGASYARNIRDAGEDIAAALQLMQKAAEAYKRSDELYTLEYA